jgi:hypothetical protein
LLCEQYTAGKFSLPGDKQSLIPAPDDSLEEGNNVLFLERGLALLFLLYLLLNKRGGLLQVLQSAPDGFS